MPVIAKGYEQLPTQTKPYMTLPRYLLLAHSIHRAYMTTHSSCLSNTWVCFLHFCAQPKEMFCTMPVMCVKGVAADRVDTQGVYLCPVYKTEQRGPTYVFSAQLKTKSPPGRWVLAGVGLIMDVA